MTEYALYKGEDIIAIGTADEIAREMGIKKATVFYYHSPAHKKRTSEGARRLVKLEDEDEI